MKDGIIELVDNYNILQTYTAGEVIFMACLIGASVGVIVYIILDLINDEI